MIASLVFSFKEKKVIFAQRTEYFIKDCFRKCDQIRKKLKVCPHLLKTFFMQNFIFRVVYKEQMNL